MRLHCFLIDSNGIIVADDIRHEELEKGWRTRWERKITLRNAKSPIFASRYQPRASDPATTPASDRCSCFNPNIPFDKCHKPTYKTCCIHC